MYNWLISIFFSFFFIIIIITRYFIIIIIFLLFFIFSPRLRSYKTIASYIEHLVCCGKLRPSKC